MHQTMHGIRRRHSSEGTIGGRGAAALAAAALVPGRPLGQSAPGGAGFRGGQGPSGHHLGVPQVTFSAWVQYCAVHVQAQQAAAKYCFVSQTV